MTKVIKRDGKLVKFNPLKLKRSIAAAAREAKPKLPAKRVKQIVGQVSRPVISSARKKKTIKSKELRNKIVKKLNAVEPSVAKAWRKWEKRH